MEKNRVDPKPGEVDDNMKRVHDSSLDHKGRVPLRASTGSWESFSLHYRSSGAVGVERMVEEMQGWCSKGEGKMVVEWLGLEEGKQVGERAGEVGGGAIEFSERLSYFGIATSLVIYLTKVIHQDLETAVKNVNYWSGVTTLMPLLGGFLADAYLGRYTTVIASCIVYLMGLVLLSLSWFLPGLKPCDHANMCIEPRRAHEVAFFLAIYLISIGTGGHKPSLESFGADQFDDDHVEERRQKMSFFNWWNCGRPSYRYREPTGSPLTPMLHVLVAAISKRNLPYPSNPSQLYEVSKSNGKNERFLAHTKKLKFLDKAAIVENEGNLEQKQSPWRLTTVTRVEEMKLIINMIPIWVFTLPFGICASQTSTLFIKQGAAMDRKIGNGFEIPPASIFTLAAIGMIVSVAIYDKILVPMLRRINENERGISILQRIGFGMLFSVITMIVAALVERKRLKVVEMNPSKGSISMNVFWLAPQLLIIGFGDGLTLVGLQEYFYDQVPDSMRSLGIGLYLSVIGAGSFLSGLLITIVNNVTGKSGKGWIGKDLNSSRLDKFYWLVAAITTMNLFVFVFFARQYSYKNVQNDDDGEENKV
ncbi:Proton-dependent oligopeptide transporter family [Sesbania bispinosa]|nr:Proton-dependent oligopeptide transporter family [Sesbania bispinosa]